jgi:hypothetical protein
MNITTPTRIAAGVTAAVAALAVVWVVTADGSGSQAAETKPLPQRFTLTSDTVDGVDKPIRVVATGRINGTATVIAPQASRVEHLTFRFESGSLTLLVRETSFVARPDLATCSATETAAGRFRITDGTGAFRDASGGGAFRRHTLITGARDPSGACAGQNTPPEAIHSIVRFTGRVALHRD